MRNWVLTVLFFTSALISAATDLDSARLVFNPPKREYSFILNGIIPVGAFGELYKYTKSSDPAESLRKSIEGENGGMGARLGYGFGFSGYYYFNKRPVQTTGGLKVTYLAYDAVPFKWKQSGYVFDGADFNDFRFLSFKIGPVMRVITAKNVAIHLYSQVVLTHCWNASWKNEISSVYYDDYSNRYSSSDHSEFKMNSGNGIRNETGLSVRILRLLLQVNYSFGKLKFNNVHFERNYSVSVEEYHSWNHSYSYYDSDSENFTSIVKAKMPTGMIGISAGYIFGK